MLIMSEHPSKFKKISARDASNLNETAEHVGKYNLNRQDQSPQAKMVHIYHSMVPFIMSIFA